MPLKKKTRIRLQVQRKGDVSQVKRTSKDKVLYGKEHINNPLIFSIKKDKYHKNKAALIYDGFQDGKASLIFGATDSIDRYIEIIEQKGKNPESVIAETLCLNIIIRDQIIKSSFDYKIDNALVKINTITDKELFLDRKTFITNIENGIQWCLSKLKGLEHDREFNLSVQQEAVNNVIKDFNLCTNLVAKDVE
jgi:hypothetical protein